MSQSEYDYEGYEKSLGKVLSLSEKDYWTQYVDINRHQVNVSKTYLWVSVALVGAYVAVYDRYSEVVFGSACSITLAAICFISALVAFGLCLSAIPAREGYKSIPHQSWGEFPQLANQLLTAKKSNIYAKVLTDMVNKVDIVTVHNVSTNQKRARLLRATSWVLLFSLVFSFLTAISSFSNHYLSLIKPEVTTMSDDNETTSTTTSQATESGPDVPVPAGPIATANPNITTHGVRITDAETRITESAPETKSGDSE